MPNCTGTHHAVISSTVSCLTESCIGIGCPRVRQSQDDVRRVSKLVHSHEIHTTPLSGTNRQLHTEGTHVTHYVEPSILDLLELCHCLS